MPTIWVFCFFSREQKVLLDVVLTKIVRIPGYRDELPYSAIRLKPSSLKCILVTEGTYYLNNSGGID